MARIQVRKFQLFFVDGTEVVPILCAKDITLGDDTEEDIDVTCLDDEEDNFDPGKMTPGEGSIGTDLDDENESHLKMLELSKTKPRKKVMFYMGSGHSDDPPTVAQGGAVSLPQTRNWWAWEAYLKAPARTFEKAQLVGYNYPMKRTSSVNETFRTISP
jgi:hypothetical protein